MENVMTGQYEQTSIAAEKPPEYNVPENRSYMGNNNPTSGFSLSSDQTGNLKRIALVGTPIVLGAIIDKKNRVRGGLIGAGVGFGVVLYVIKQAWI